MKLTNRINSNPIGKKNIKTAIGLLSCIFMLVNFSCSDDCNPCSSNTNIPDNSIKGSGNLISEIRNFDSFNSVHISTAGTVFLTQDDTQKVEVTVDDNLMQYIYLEVLNNTLIINVESEYNLHDMHLSVDVSIPVLNEIHTSSAGNFIGQNTFTCDNLRLLSSSAGNIFLDFDGTHLYTNLSSAGNANLQGTVDTHDAFVSSAGSLHAFNLESDTTTIILNSAGNAEVYVNDLLNAYLSSAGSLFYKGYPVINATVSSLGIIVNAN